MYLNITDSEKGDNKGSCGQLVHYLEKENRIYKLAQTGQWFNGLGSGYSPYEIRNKLDGNKARLCSTDAKFFLINISPSQKEIAHLKYLYGEQGAKDKLKDFSVKVIDEYARNFKKEQIMDNRDLLWFAKLENHRYYSQKDIAVKNGTARRGEVKPGEQMHVQVIVSRKDITNKIKLSPNNNSRGTNAAHAKRVGQFDRVVFKNIGERVFDEMFGFNRPISDTFNFSNSKVNGTLAERLADLEKKHENDQPADGSLKLPYLEAQSLPANGHVNASLLEVLLAKPEFDSAPSLKRKKKRKKGRGQEAGLNF